MEMYNIPVQNLLIIVDMLYKILNFENIITFTDLY